jgi:tRNA 5-methylaminomethyl-2-thiouridine biosynthesis bifunctional protein
MPGIPVEPLDVDEKGTPWSARYGDVLASRDGALGQARHVFLGGNGLPARWAGRDQFVVVETGFGLGVNFMATWQAWREDAGRCRRLHFVSVEGHPLAPQDLVRHAPPPLAALAHLLAAQWPLPLSGVHRLVFEDGAVTLTLALGDAATVVPGLRVGADAFYLDGFAPDRNPQMWDARLLKSVSRLARHGATLATWSTASAVREALASCGFEFGLADGFGSKRRMLTAHYAPRFRTRRHDPASPYGGRRSAIVIGTGLAGCACALALARRGWTVTVLEAGARIAGAASSLPAGLLHPMLAADDNLAARLMRAGFLCGRKLLESIDEAGRVHRRCGVFDLAPAGDGQSDWRELLQRQHWPQAFVQWRAPASAAPQTGLVPRHEGLWFGDAAAVDAGGLCRAMLQAGGGIVTHAERRAVTLSRHGDAWIVADHEGQRWSAAIAVVAAALQAPALAKLRFAPVKAVRGRVSLLAGTEFKALRAGITGRGYLLPTFDGQVALGATYEPAGPEDGPALGESVAHESNLDRLPFLLAQVPEARITGVFDQVRCVAHDRTPMAGPVCDEAQALDAGASLQGAHLDELPRLQGLYCLAALGSRGLGLAPLLGELIAAHAEGEPLPVERALADSVDPGRFLLRHLRKAN